MTKKFLTRMENSAVVTEEIEITETPLGINLGLPLGKKEQITHTIAPEVLVFYGRKYSASLRPKRKKVTIDPIAKLIARKRKATPKAAPRKK